MGAGACIKAKCSGGGRQEGHGGGGRRCLGGRQFCLFSGKEGGRLGNGLKGEGGGEIVSQVNGSLGFSSQHCHGMCKVQSMSQVFSG